MKSSKVSIKTRSTPASLSFIGQATKHTTVKWSIQPRSQGLSSLPPLSLEAEKRDPGNEVGENYFLMLFSLRSHGKTDLPSGRLAIVMLQSTTSQELKSHIERPLLLTIA